MYWRPHSQKESKQYPTLLYVYGGPHVQLVVNSYALTVQYKRYQVKMPNHHCCYSLYLGDYLASGPYSQFHFSASARSCWRRRGSRA